MRPVLLLGMLALWGPAAHAQPMLVDLATISMSAPDVPRLTANNVCATDGTDLVCDRGIEALSGGLLTATRVSATNISATNLTVNGVAITGSGGGGTGDRIISSTTAAAIANQTGGTISFTLGSTAGAAYLHPTLGLVAPGVSTTGRISATAGYFAGTVGVGTTSPSRTMHINGGGTATFLRLQNTNTSATQLEFMRNGLGSYIGPANAAEGFDMFTFENIPIRLGQNGSIRLTIDTSGRAGIGTTNPAALLDVSGTIRLANGGEACDAGRTGAIRFTGGDFSVCRNGTAWETLTSIAGGGGTNDRIVSSTTAAAIANQAGGTISFTLGGTAGAAYLHPTLGLVGPGVSTTGTISGVLVTSPRVSATNVSATNISVTNLTVNGQAITSGGLPNCNNGETIIRQNGAWVCTDNPDTFMFTDLTNQQLNTLVTSNIVAITGTLSAQITVSGGGSPQYRICSDINCTSVVRNWGSTASNVTQGQFVQLRLTSSNVANASQTATAQIGAVSDAWVVSTQLGHLGLRITIPWSNWYFLSEVQVFETTSGGTNLTPTMSSRNRPGTGFAGLSANQYVFDSSYGGPTPATLGDGTVLGSGGAWNESQGATNQVFMRFSNSGINVRRVNVCFNSMSVYGNPRQPSIQFHITRDTVPTWELLTPTSQSDNPGPDGDGLDSGCRLFVF